MSKGGIYDGPDGPLHGHCIDPHLLDLDASIAATLATRPVRDPDAECRVFTTRPGEKQDCYGDGHYLCFHCTRYLPESERDE